MKWFKHDSNALHDAKIEKLIMKYGIEGYGLYFACVEIIAGKLTPENFTFELEHDAEILAHKFQVDTLKVEEMMRYCVDLGLFEINGDNRITCMKLAQRLDNATLQNKELQETLRNFKLLKAEEKRIDKKRREEEKKPAPPKGKYGEFQNVRLTQEEHQKLVTTYGDQVTRKYIESLGGWLAQSNKHYKSHYATIRNWCRRDSIPEVKKEGWYCKQCNALNTNTGQRCLKCGEFRE